MQAVLVAYAYPPFPVVGSIRAERVAQTLLDAGYQVHVVTRRLEGESDRFRVKSDDLVVEPVSEWPHPTDWYRRLRGSRAEGGAGDDLGGHSTEVRWKPPERPPAWKTLILWATQIPDEHLGFVIPALLAARRALSTTDGLVYTTTPPHSAQLVGLVLQAVWGCEWIAEYRDPWSGNTALESERSPLESRLRDLSDRWLERICLGKADRTVAVSEKAAQHMSRLWPGEQVAVTVIRNGIPSLESPPAAIRHGPMRILYVGGLGGSRDPRLFLRALANCRGELDLGPEDVQVHFVGNCRFYRDVDLAEESKSLALSDLVHFSPWVPQEQAIELQSTADLLVLFAQQQPAQVPNKLYEYLGTGLPIIAFVDSDGESAQMLRRVGGHWLVTDDDIGCATSAMRQAILARRDGVRYPRGRPDRELLEEWTVERQFDTLRRILEGRP